MTSSGSGLTTTTYYTTQEMSAAGGSPKYHQESTTVASGHDNFTDFVTLVCQTTAQEPTGGGSGRSPTKLVSYYTTAAPATVPSSTATGPAMYTTQTMTRALPLRIPGTYTVNSNTKHSSKRIGKPFLFLAEIH
jgi:hypothetical protein